MKTCLRITVVFAVILALMSVFAYAEDINTELRRAAQSGDTHKVQELIAAGADVNAEDKYGKTALMKAADLGHTETVKALLAAGADVNAKRKDGRTALIFAERRGHTKIVELLKKAGATRAAMEKPDRKPAVTAMKTKSAKDKLAVQKTKSPGKDVAVQEMKGPKNAAYWLDKGALCATYGNDEGAVRYFKKAIEFDQKSSQAYFNLGISHGEIGQYQEAISSIDKAIEMDPGKGLYYYGRGRVCLLSGDKVKAMEDFKRAAELGNQDAQDYLAKTTHVAP